jgi:hypothetical protein
MSALRADWAEGVVVCQSEKRTRRAAFGALRLKLCLYLTEALKRCRLKLAGRSYRRGARYRAITAAFLRWRNHGRQRREHRCG